jgi:uncharacterized membrane protein YkvA (DUF1232 family)
MQEQYSEKGFWEKLAAYAFAAGREVVEKALQLYYAAQNPDTPAWAKSVIYGALAYFILPLDAIPDTIPLAGYSDDLGAIALALATVAAYVTPDVKEKAKSKLQHWFGHKPDEPNPPA